MYRLLATMLLGSTLLTACSGAPSQATKETKPAESAPAENTGSASEESGPRTDLPVGQAGPYTVQAYYLGELSNGHFNFDVSGGEVKALRAWVGDEAATGAMVTKANWEENHYCSPMEMPGQLPAGAALWFEIEGADGAIHKSSVPLGAASASATASDEVPAMRNFAAIKIGPYDVQPMFEEEIEDGHFNIKITGGEVKAVRGWVGPEDASGVMVVKTEIENDYHHGHYEIPTPLPADAVWWIEIETPTGETLKGSTPLELVP